jgi:hypothetical protein
MLADHTTEPLSPRVAARQSWVLRASVAGLLTADVAEEARTRGFAAPAFAGCALVVTDVTAGRSTLRLGTETVKKLGERHRAREFPMGSDLTAG